MFVSFSRLWLAPLALTAIASLCLVSCSKEPEPEPEQSSPVEKTELIQLDKLQRVLATNADIAYAVYSDAVDTASALQSAIETFASKPSEKTLEQVKRAWLTAREPYGQSEVYRFRLSPIDSTNYRDEDGPEGAINAWPLGEALIDYTVSGNDFGNDQLGVSAHTTEVKYPQETLISSNLAITPELLAKSASADDERDVISGYHAIEFMLWGQDLNRDGSADTQNARDQSTSQTGLLNSGGQRPLEDFTTDRYAERRLRYLEVLAEKLVADLTQVRDAWAPGASYREAFTQVKTPAEAKRRLAEILTGMGTLSEGELAGERMQIAFSSNSQEDEHSCFSDNTHRDVWLNAEGVSNSYYGRYEGYDSTQDAKDDQTQRALNGYGLDAYLDEVGLTELAASIEAALSNTEQHYQAIDRSARAEGKPFDVLIMDSHRNAENPIYKTIIALNAQSARIAQIADALQLDSQVVDDEASACNTTTPDKTCE